VLHRLLHLSGERLLAKVRLLSPSQTPLAPHLIQDDLYSWRESQPVKREPDAAADTPVRNRLTSALKPSYNSLYLCKEGVFTELVLPFSIKQVLIRRLLQ